LEVELTNFATRVEQICRGHGKLNLRLRLAQVILQTFAGHPEFSSPHFFRLALICPESAWLLFHLRKKRLRDHQALQDYLAQNSPLEPTSPLST
jgi:hypothetical protein